MANSSITLASLDFDSIKDSLKLYLQSQDRFSDYDFEGSNISVILDVLAYNSFQNAFYLNMTGNEMFLDTAILRDSAVSHAKTLNYTPRSFNSASASVNIAVTVPNTAITSLTLPAYTTFTSTVGNDSYTFSTEEDIILNNPTRSGNNNIFTSTGTTLSEGVWITDTFVVRPNDNSRFVLTNKTVDTSSLVVTVLEDNQATTLNYTQATSLLGLDSTSQSFFLQGAENYSYEVVFGDGVVARKPKDNSVVIVRYRSCSGLLPNGASVFTSDGPIDGYSNVSITTLTSAAGGAIAEDVDSIKFNAPRHFQTQERAVTVEDYRNLLLATYPEINAVNAYGGEVLEPPQFGKVFIAVDLTAADQLPQTKKDQYYSFLKARCPIAIDPVFVDPAYTYVEVVSSVDYNINTTALSPSDIRSLVIAAIESYSNRSLNTFAATLRYSKLIGQIDQAQDAIVSNDTSIRLIKRITPTRGVPSQFDVDFADGLTTVLTSLPPNASTLESSSFQYNGATVKIADDGKGTLNVVSAGDRNTIAQRNIGTINYESGLLQFSNLIVSDYINYIKLYAVAGERDLETKTNTILAIDPADISVNVTPIRL